MQITLRDAAPADEAAFRRLWAGYLAFYRTDLAEAVTARTWARILDPGSPIFARLAEAGGAVVGFAVCVVHEGSWVDSPILYLEDLFVDADLRGRGIGRRLIEDLRALGRQNGWSRLYRHTEADNHAARALYDRFVQADGVRYRIAL